MSKSPDAKLDHTRDARFSEFLRALSSGQGLPGSGAAGAVALALAAACAAKAAAISLKHVPNNSQLEQARTVLLDCIDRALEGSDEDSARFATFLHRRDSQSAERVIEADEKLLALVDSITALIDSLDPQVRHNVAGDLVAARALSEAARTIQAQNIAEMRGQNHPAR